MFSTVLTLLVLQQDWFPVSAWNSSSGTQQNNPSFLDQPGPVQAELWCQARRVFMQASGIKLRFLRHRMSRWGEAKLVEWVAGPKLRSADQAPAGCCAVSMRLVRVGTFKLLGRPRLIFGRQSRNSETPQGGAFFFHSSRPEV